MIITGLLIFTLSPFVFAQPLDEQKQEAKKDVERLQQKVEESVERYSYACYKVNETESKIDENKVALVVKEEELSAAKGRLNNRVRAMYMTRRSTFLDVAVNAQSFDEFLVGVEFSKKVAESDATIVAQVKNVKAELEAAREALARQKSEQEAAKKEMASAKQAVEKELSGAKGKLSNIEGQIEAAMVARQNEAASYSRSSSYSSYSSISNPIQTGPPPGVPNDGVVGVAYAQLGKPYVWAAAGPNSFDCSGLVQYCYAQGAGISLPHSSYAQAGCGARVSASELAPGDILGFRGWGHVGIYVGGGQYIHAPHSGDVVRVASLASRSFCGAVRP